MNPGPRSGTVRSFGEDGWGIVVLEPGGSELAFHCTAISDRTRTIPAGATVVIEVVPGRAGRWEAGWVQPVTVG